MNDMAWSLILRSLQSTLENELYVKKKKKEFLPAWDRLCQMITE